jgi:glyoxylase I family protein
MVCFSTCNAFRNTTSSAVRSVPKGNYWNNPGSVGNLKFILSGPGASGSRPMPDGRKQEPGGWNRVVLQVSDLPARIEVLKKAELHFRNEMQVGAVGKQILLEDPDGNPIELFEPAR